MAAAAIGGVAALIALLVFGLRSTATSDEIRSALDAGRPAEAPTFTLDVLSPGTLSPPLRRVWQAAAADGRVSLEELDGVPVVVNFWASWCDPCREEAPVLERGWTRDSERGVLYVGLDMQDLTGDARAFIDEFGLTYPTIRDPGREVADQYGLTGIPETVFIDAEGRVVALAIGAVDANLLEVGARAAEEGRVAGLLQGGDQRAPR